MENKEIAEILEYEFKIWSERDIDAIVSQWAGSVGGFGWRTPAWRGTAYTSAVKAFLDNFDEYEFKIEELHTWSEGETGLAWGVFIERFRPHGQQREEARVRFTLTLRKTQDRWRQIMYHRDIQPFNSDGRYPVELTRVNE